MIRKQISVFCLIYFLTLFVLKYCIFYKTQATSHTSIYKERKIKKEYQSQLEYITRKVLKAIWIVFGIGGGIVSFVALGFSIFGVYLETSTLIIALWLAFVVIFAFVSWVILSFSIIVSGIYEGVRRQFL